MKFVKTLKSRGKEIEEWEELRGLLKKYDVKLAYLFGSYAKEEITRFSDIDIAVLFEKDGKGQMDSLRVDLMEILEEV